MKKNLILVIAIPTLLISGYVAVSSSKSSDYQETYKLSEPPKTNPQFSTDSNFEYEEPLSSREDAIRELEMEIFQQNAEIIESSNEMLLDGVGDE